MRTSKVKNNLAIARAKSVRTSPRKLNIVLQQIRGSSINDAVTQLQYSKRGISSEVLKVLNSAIANAESNKGMDIDKLFVLEAYCGRSMVMKRFKAAARGRAKRIEKPFSNMVLVLSERGGK